MRGAVLLAALLFACPGRAAAAADPLAGAIADMEQDGYSVRKRLVFRAGKGPLAALIFRDGSGYDRLKVYTLDGGKARVIYLELSSSKQIDFDPLHAGGKVPDLYGDKTKTLAYKTLYNNGRQHYLHLIRFGGGKVVQEPLPLPNARLQDVDGDGRLEVVTRATPLGQLFAVECDSFRSMAQTAFRTTIYVVHEGRLVPASKSFPRYYDEHIAELEGEIAGNDPRNSQRYGDYLGSALSLYFDYAEKGLPQQGWSRFSDLFRPSSGDPGGVSNCIRMMKGDIRRRLAIPDNWPD